MKRLFTALIALVAVVGMAHAGSTKDEITRKAQQHTAAMAAQPAVNLRSITNGQFQPLRVDATLAACDSSEPGIVIHDDGELENGYGWNAIANYGKYAERYVPAAYPATLTTVCAAFITNAGATDFNLTLSVYDDDGTGGEPGTLLGQLDFVAHPTAIADLPAAPNFESFDLSSLGLNITDGGVYISVEWDAATAPAGVFIAADESTTTPLQEGYSASNGEAWAPIQSASPDYRALMIRPVLAIAGPGAPGLSKAFAPSQIATGEISTLTITLNNMSQPTAAVLSTDLVDTFPADLVVAATPNASTTCTSGTLIADAGTDTVTLVAGAEIPAQDTCTISVDVTSSVDGGYDNVIAAGSLQTQHGNNPNDATAHLQVGFVFPEPYCPIDFPSSVEPITHVQFADIDNTSDATIGGSPALENFTAIIGNVAPGETVQMAVEGNTSGSYTTPIKVYIDWNQNDIFDADEGYLIGELQGSTGTDGQQAVNTIDVPLNALPGETRMRVTKKFSSPADACNTTGYGQAEDYTLDVAPISPAPRVSKAFAPVIVMPGAPSTLTITLTNDQNTGDATLDADFTDTFPTGLVVAATPNASTTCGTGTVTANAGDGFVTLASGATIPGGGTCTITVDATSATDGVYDNLIPAGALVTDLGNSPFDAEASLQIGFVFPQPYCEVDFPSDVEPITRVLYADIDNPSDSAVNGTPALQDFTGIIGNVRAGKAVSMAVEGNTNGSFTSVIKVYIDLDQSDSFEPNEGFLIGDLVNSTGTDGKQAVNDIMIPVDAAIGTTRMRVTKRFSAAADACNTSGYGQAEDYTLEIAPPVPEVSKTFAPETVRINEPSTATITVGNPTANAATLTAPLVDSFPAGLTVSNVTTDCGLIIGDDSNVIMAANDVGLPSGLVLPARSTCQITATVEAAAAGTYVNSIPAGALQTDQGANDEPAEATLTVIDSPYITKAFTPSTVERTMDSTAVITLFNPGTADAALTAPLVDNLPGGLIVTGASTTCINSGLNGHANVTAANVSLPVGAVIPAGGSCKLEITVHADTLGSFVNEIDAGALQTDQGSNFDAASATLVVTALAIDPVVTADPGSLAASQSSNTVTTQMLDIGNTGGSDLNWTVAEAEAIGGPAAGNPAGASGYGASTGGNSAGAVSLRGLSGASSLPFPLRVTAATDCDASVPNIIIHDDGEAENGSGWNPVAGVGRLADPFTPASYPAGISTVCMAFISNTGVTSFNFDVVVYAADGAGGAPGTELGRKSFVGHPDAISGVPATPTYEAFDLSDQGINVASGSVYISAEWDAAVEPAGVFLAVDESLTTPLQNGYSGANGAAWQPIIVDSPDYRALFIRAVMGAAGPASCTTTDVPWLSVTPTSGTTTPGASSSVAVSFDSTNMASGTYTAQVCISSNDPVTPVVKVPVSMTVDAADPSATVTPTSLAFNVAADATADQTLDIANAGGSDPLTFSIMARGSNNATFRLQPTNREMKHAIELFAAHPPMLAAGNSAAEPNVQQAAWLPPVTLDGTPLVFMHDDGSAETAIGWGSDTGEAMAVYLNQFQPPAGTGAYTITSVSVMWPDETMGGGPLDGLEANLVFYYDFTPDNGPGDAIRIGGDNLVTIGLTGEFETYPVSIAVPGDGVVYVGWVDQWAQAGDYMPRLYPGAIDQGTSMGMSWIAADSETVTDINNLGNNDTIAVLDDIGFPGNWMIRAVGSTGTSCTGPAISWLSVAPASGSVDGADSVQVTVTADPAAAGLGAGVYQADLCITTNDPTQTMIAIPVTMTVTAADGIFCDGFELGGDGSCDTGTTPPVNAQGIVASGPLNIALPASFDGTTIDLLSGAACHAGSGCEGQLNIYTGNNGELGFLWPNRAPRTGGVAGNGGASFAVLQKGATIGPNSTLAASRIVKGGSWNAGADGYLGFAFDCSSLGTSATGVCYGYAHLVTSKNGADDRLVEYSYDMTGASITIH